MPDSPNQSAALLVGIGELKGQMQAIQGFLTSHTERMDRQDERMDRQDERMNEFSRNLHEHTQADKASHDSILERQSKSLNSQGERIGKVEMKIAYWSGGLFIIGLIAQTIIKKLGFS